MKKIFQSMKPRTLAIVIAILLFVLFGALSSPDKALSDPIASDAPKTEAVPSSTTKKSDEAGPNQTDAAISETAPPASSDQENTQGTDEADPLEIPPYSGKPFSILNNNIPNFSEEELKTVGYEVYSDLDVLGRTGAAVASVGKDTMPQDGETRGSISSIKPSGWIQATYDHISGKYLYNRCHLIGWQLSAENANPRNLVTGTKYLNVSGMLPFENMVADYIKETSHHVAYRITPVYDGDNLLPSGIKMEAYSVEDRGEGISFHVFCYNVQPGVKIDYSNGASTLDQSAPAPTSAPTTTTVPPQTSAPQKTETPAESTVFITKSGKRYHSTKACSGLKNAKAIYDSSLADAKNKGLTPCSICY